MSAPRMISIQIDSCSECGFFSAARYECENPECDGKKIQRPEGIPWWCPLEMAAPDESTTG